MADHPRRPRDIQLALDKQTNANMAVYQPSLAEIRESLFTAVVSDALDALGHDHHAPRIPLRPFTSTATLVGRCRTTLWAEMSHADPQPYALELQAVDACQVDDVLIAAAGGSLRAGVWGELLSTAAAARGCVGAIVDGAIRDVAKMQAMPFPVYARGTSPYDSKDRLRVIDLDVPVPIADAVFHPGDLVIADVDGVVVLPQALEAKALAMAWQKVHDENQVRAAIQQGMLASDAYEKYGTL